MGARHAFKTGIFRNAKSDLKKRTKLFQLCHDTVGNHWYAFGKKTIHHPLLVPDK